MKDKGKAHPSSLLPGTESHCKGQTCMSCASHRLLSEVYCVLDAGDTKMNFLTLRN